MESMNWYVITSADYNVSESKTTYKKRTLYPGSVITRSVIARFHCILDASCEATIFCRKVVVFSKDLVSDAEKHVKS